jgi:hypothetical protein
MGGSCSENWKNSKRYKILVGKSKRKRPRTEKSRRRLEDSIKICLKKGDMRVVERIYRALNRVQRQILVNTVMKIWVP